ncbi:hypothetical protein BV20DRAFT_543370 [Pilatotrama ljubarskyi]|nr:hypothetical protein BV20DRAFT_543370 [Pilatotrama ljubarskyi]
MERCVRCGVGYPEGADRPSCALHPARIRSVFTLSGRRAATLLIPPVTNKGRPYSVLAATSGARAPNGPLCRPLSARAGRDEFPRPSSVDIIQEYVDPNALGGCASGHRQAAVCAHARRQATDRRRRLLPRQPPARSHSASSSLTTTPAFSRRVYPPVF